VPGAFAVPVDFVSSLQQTAIPFTTGRDLDSNVFVIRRAGVTAIERDSSSLVQFLRNPQSGEEVLLERTDQADTFTLRMRDAHGITLGRIALRVPSKVSALSPGTQFVPFISDWYPAAREWLVSFTCGCEATPPSFVLRRDGTLSRATWLGSFIGGTPTADGSEVLFLQPTGCSTTECRYRIALADLRRESVRTVARSSDAQGSFVISPNRSLFAYGRLGARIGIAQMSDGLATDATSYEAADLFPVGWLDETHLVAVATSPDLLTGQATAAIVLVTLPQQQNPPPQLLVKGSGNIQFLGLLK